MGSTYYTELSDDDKEEQDQVQVQVQVQVKGGKRGGEEKKRTRLASMVCLFDGWMEGWFALIGNGEEMRLRRQRNKERRRWIA